MTRQELQEVKGKLNNYRYSSMQYLDDEGIHDYAVQTIHRELMLLRGFNRECGRLEYHWAANDAAALLGAMGGSQGVLVTFVPHGWVDAFLAAGFTLFAAWHDYFRQTLGDITHHGDAAFLRESECEAASAVTQACRGQSRGFTGQTAEWMRQWLKGEESASGADASNHAVLVQRSRGEIIGILCTATYAHGSEKGPVAWIREVAVKPACQGRGIGRQLMLQALAYGKACGATRAFLAADECNHSAIRLYASLGFTPGEEPAQIDMTRG